MVKEELYMQRVFELAVNGAGLVSPNPMVGCVIVKNDKIIGEGWHQSYGSPHAEVNAINSVVDKAELEGAELYVNLEPCTHFGKTPPCADLVCTYNFKSVYISNTDPNPLVAGKGIEKIRNAGIVVHCGILEKQGNFLNRRFFTFFRKRRPYIILKWAQTLDGFIARTDFTSKWISNPFSRKLVHKWRSEEDAVLVGRNTASCDNPKLNVRDWKGRNPRRIVLDPGLVLTHNLHLFDQTQSTIIYNNVKTFTKGKNEFVRLSPSENFLSDIAEDLFNRKVQSVIVEGGSKALASFIQSGMWDEVRRFTGETSFQTGIPAPVFIGNRIHKEDLYEDQLEVFINPDLEY